MKLRFSVLLAILFAFSLLAEDSAAPNETGQSEPALIEAVSTGAPDGGILDVNLDEAEAALLRGDMEALEGIARSASPANGQPAFSLMERIQPILQEEKQKLAQLHLELESATQDEAPAILLLVESLKQETEIRILAAQAELARDRGNETLAEEIDLAVEEILNPAPRQYQPESRPLPGHGN
ncbi:MAG: hypothetical protein QGG80_05305 [Candidatus Krumholzibacteria bacterium]|nr:hypothetical protein [Candidatus Krumholzibacteria bacterium]